MVIPVSEALRERLNESEYQTKVEEAAESYDLSLPPPSGK
jgi:hypothetical protein